ncbi:MAG: hypothetical protein ACREFO_21195 [Acetobacteraceae bacterium]
MFEARDGVRALSPASASSSLGAQLGLGEVDEDELYAGLDWLHECPAVIEAALPKRHLKNGALVLYDVSSSFLEGRCCPLAKLGYNRDVRKGTLQITYGWLCAADRPLRCHSTCYAGGTMGGFALRRRIPGRTPNPDYRAAAPRCSGRTRASRMRHGRVAGVFDAGQGRRCGGFLANLGTCSDGDSYRI